MTDENEHIEEEEVIESQDEGTEDETIEEEVESEEEDETVKEEESTASKTAAEGSKSRSSTRISELNRRLREEETRRIKAETLAEERATPRQPANSDEAKRIREEKLALMDPSEKKQFLSDEKMEQMQSQILLTQLQTQDAIDKSSYSTAAARNTVFAKHADEVEKRLKSERMAGRNWNRETILAQIIGENALKAKPDTKKKDEAKERVDSSKTKAPSGRSNSSAYRPGRGGESLEDMERRLGDVVF